MTDAEFQTAVLQRFDAIDQHLAANDQRLDSIDQRLAANDQRFDSIDQRLDELTAETTLMRAALERFGFMGRTPKPPAPGPSHGGASGMPVAAQGAE